MLSLFDYLLAHYHTRVSMAALLVAIITRTSWVKLSTCSAFDTKFLFNTQMHTFCVILQTLLIRRGKLAPFSLTFKYFPSQPLMYHACVQLNWSRCAELLFTNAARIWFFAGVNPIVHIEALFEEGAVGTLVTFVLLPSLAEMDTFVRADTRGLYKCLATDVTFEFPVTKITHYNDFT